MRLLLYYYLRLVDKTCFRKYVDGQMDINTWLAEHYPDSLPDRITVRYGNGGHDDVPAEIISVEVDGIVIDADRPDSLPEGDEFCSGE